MKTNRSLHLNRRAFLAQGAAATGGLLALPQFASLGNLSAAPGESPRRLVVIHVNLSLYPYELYPKTAGTKFTAPRLLKPLEKHRGNYTLFNGLDHTDVSGGHAVVSTLLTGENFKLRADKRHTVSLDHYLAERVGIETRFDKINLLAAPGNAANVSYDSNGTPSPGRIVQAEELYNKLFVTDPDEQRQLAAKVASNRSILDGLRAEVKELEGRLDAGDRSRLEHYLNAIRELETRMAKQVKWSGIEKPTPKGGKPPARPSKPGMHAYMPAMFGLATLALQTDSTRVMTIGIGAGNIVIPGVEFTFGYHPLSHHGKREDKIAQLLAIEEAHMQQVAGFIDQLATTSDANGKPLLDTTTVLLSSGLGNAHSHSNQNLPVLVIGGGYRHRGYVDLRDRDVPLCNLYVNFARRMGVECEKFGTSNGNFTELS